MRQPQDDGKPVHQESRPAADMHAHAKKTYVPPRLLEYGSIRALTEGKAGSRKDKGEPAPAKGLG